MFHKVPKSRKQNHPALSCCLRLKKESFAPDGIFPNFVRPQQKQGKSMKIRMPNFGFVRIFLRFSQ